MTKAFCFKHVLSFNTPGGTSRGVLNQKTSWFIVVKNEKKIKNRKTILILKFNDYS